MNAPLHHIDSIDSYSDLLPPDFILETERRKAKLHHNQEQAQEYLDGVDRSCSSLSTGFDCLRNNFEKNAASYARLEQANRKNHTVYSGLGEQLRELSRQLKACGQTLRRSSCVKHYAEGERGLNPA